MSNDYKISEESAQEQIGLFNEWYDIDPEDFCADEVVEANKNLKASYLYAIRKLNRAIRKGRLEIREETGKSGEPVLIVEQILSRPIGDLEKIQYKELSGIVRSTIKYEESDNETRRTYKMLGILSGEGYKFFHGLKGADIGVADSLGFLYMQV